MRKEVFSEQPLGKRSGCLHIPFIKAKDKSINFSMAFSAKKRKSHFYLLKKSSAFMSQENRECLALKGHTNLNQDIFVSLKKKKKDSFYIDVSCQFIRKHPSDQGP